jgi:hypothetical protein
LSDLAGKILDKLLGGNVLKQAIDLVLPLIPGQLKTFGGAGAFVLAARVCADDVKLSIKPWSEEWISWVPRVPTIGDPSTIEYINGSVEDVTRY